MEVIAVVSLITLTSASGYLVGRGFLGLSNPLLGAAIRQMLGYLGVSLGFAVVNLLIGAAAILMFREATGTFVPLYLIDDNTVIVASVLQGIVLFSWCQLSIRGDTAREEP